MSTQRITITLPSGILEGVRKEAKQRRRPVSRIVAEALVEREEERVRRRMIEAYKAMAEENERLAQEWLPVSAETWPLD